VAFLKAFGAYLPERRVSNAELGERLGAAPEWIQSVCGIEERRFAAEGEGVADMAVPAAQDCLTRAGLEASDVGMVIVSSGSGEDRFPGPASSVAARLGCGQVPAWDLPLASAGGLFGMALANGLAARYGNVLVVAAEKMSAVCLREPLDRNVAVLFGDGAGACLVSAAGGFGAITGEAIHSDGNFAADLRLSWGGPLEMNGRSVILQAGRKLPGCIGEVLARAGIAAAGVEVFLVHQANKNLIDRVALSLGVSAERFYCNIQRFGNTSSASMPIAAAEYFSSHPMTAKPVVFAAFGAGYHWGALLVESCEKNLIATDEHR
jgi:3-oxoacyl-[acyl-carrier-protein] synthase-3